ncbi:MAG TPA: hypothetical protein VMN81_14345, partial [Vicinamibacterales bacterium]|nr:hypothetical protein [Vicinamibacterales bacterium]
MCLAQAAPPSPRLWTEVRSPDHGFRAEFPADAVRSEPAPGRLKWAVELDNGFTAYLFETMNITQERLQTAGSARVLDDAVKGGIAQLPGAIVLHQGPIELGGNPGRELSMRVVHSGTTMRVTSRVFLVGTKLYMLVAVA